MGWEAERKEQKRYLSPGQYLMIGDCTELWGSVWPWLHVHPTTRYVLLLLFPLPTMLFHEHVVCVTLVLACAVYLQGQCRKDEKKWQRKGKEGRWETADASCWHIAWVYVGKWAASPIVIVTSCQAAHSKGPDPGEQIGKMRRCTCLQLQLSDALYSKYLCEISDYSFLTDKAIPLCISIVFM